MTRIALRLLLAFWFVLLGLLGVAAQFGVAVASTSARAEAAKVRSVRVPGRLYGVSCMSSSMCVLTGIGNGQGLPTELVAGWSTLRDGIVLASWNGPAICSLACRARPGPSAIRSSRTIRSSAPPVARSSHARGAAWLARPGRSTLPPTLWLAGAKGASWLAGTRSPPWRQANRARSERCRTPGLSKGWTAGPGGFFAAVGAARGPGSVVTTG
jgi:hypothetical protein